MVRNTIDGNIKEGRKGKRVREKMKRLENNAKKMEVRKEGKM